MTARQPSRKLLFRARCAADSGAAAPGHAGRQKYPPHTSQQHRAHAVDGSVSTGALVESLPDDVIPFVQRRNPNGAGVEVPPVVTPFTVKCPGDSEARIRDGYGCAEAA